MLCVHYSDRSALQTPLSSYSINSTTISQHSSVMDSDISIGGLYTCCVFVSVTGLPYRRPCHPTALTLPQSHNTVPSWTQTLVSEACIHVVCSLQ